MKKKNKGKWKGEFKNAVARLETPRPVVRKKKITLWVTETKSSLGFTGLKGDPFYLMVEGDGDLLVIDGYSLPNNFCENATEIYPGQNISYVFDGPSISSTITNCYSSQFSVSVFFKFYVEELAFFNFTLSFDPFLSDIWRL